MDPRLLLIEKNLKLPSPLELLEYPGFPPHTLIKRDDQIHPLVSGNKWRKLKYSVAESLAANSERWTSFGGAFSNHLCAISTVAHLIKMPLTVYVRGEKHFNHNPTISRMLDQGTQVEYIPRHEFREFVQSFGTGKESEFVFPEGGSHLNSLKGIQEMIQEVHEQQDLNQLDSVWVSVGTGGTLAGIIKALPAIESNFMLIKTPIAKPFFW